MARTLADRRRDEETERAQRGLPPEHAAVPPCLPIAAVAQGIPDAVLSEGPSRTIEPTFASMAAPSHHKVAAPPSAQLGDAFPSQFPTVRSWQPQLRGGGNQNSSMPPPRRHHSTPATEFIPHSHMQGHQMSSDESTSSRQAEHHPQMTNPMARPQGAHHFPPATDFHISSATPIISHPAVAPVDVFTLREFETQRGLTPMARARDHSSVFQNFLFQNFLLQQVESGGLTGRIDNPRPQMQNATVPPGTLPSGPVHSSIAGLPPPVRWSPPVGPARPTAAPSEPASAASQNQQRFQDILQSTRHGHEERHSSHMPNTSAGPENPQVRSIPSQVEDRGLAGHQQTQPPPMPNAFAVEQYRSTNQKIFLREGDSPADYVGIKPPPMPMPIINGGGPNRRWTPFPNDLSMAVRSTSAVDAYVNVASNFEEEPENMAAASQNEDARASPGSGWVYEFRRKRLKKAMESQQKPDRITGRMRSQLPPPRSQQPLSPLPHGASHLRPGSYTDNLRTPTPLSNSTQSQSQQVRTSSPFSHAPTPIVRGNEAASDRPFGVNSPLRRKYTAMQLHRMRSTTSSSLPIGTTRIANSGRADFGHYLRESTSTESTLSSNNAIASPMTTESSAWATESIPRTQSQWEQEQIALVSPITSESLAGVTENIQQQQPRSAQKQNALPSPIKIEPAVQATESIPQLHPQSQEQQISLPETRASTAEGGDTDEGPHVEESTADRRTSNRLAAKRMQRQTEQEKDDLPKGTTPNSGGHEHFEEQRTRNTSSSPSLIVKLKISSSRLIMLQRLQNLTKDTPKPNTPKPKSKNLRKGTGRQSKRVPNDRRRWHLQQEKVREQRQKMLEEELRILQDLLNSEETLPEGFMEQLAKAEEELQQHQASAPQRVGEEEIKGQGSPSTEPDSLSEKNWQIPMVLVVEDALQREKIEKQREFMEKKPMDQGAPGTNSVSKGIIDWDVETKATEPQQNPEQQRPSEDMLMDLDTFNMRSGSLSDTIPNHGHITEAEDILSTPSAQPDSTNTSSTKGSRKRTPTARLRQMQADAEADVQRKHTAKIKGASAAEKARRHGEKAERERTDKNRTGLPDRVEVSNGPHRPSISTSSHDDELMPSPASSSDVSDYTPKRRTQTSENHPSVSTGRRASLRAAGNNNGSTASIPNDDARSISTLSNNGTDGLSPVYTFTPVNAPNYRPFTASSPRPGNPPAYVSPYPPPTPRESLPSSPLEDASPLEPKSRGAAINKPTDVDAQLMPPPPRPQPTPINKHTDVDAQRMPPPPRPQPTSSQKSTILHLKPTTANKPRSKVKNTAPTRPQPLPAQPNQPVNKSPYTTPPAPTIIDYPGACTTNLRFPPYPPLQTARQFDDFNNGLDIAVNNILDDFLWAINNESGKDSGSDSLVAESGSGSTIQDKSSSAPQPSPTDVTSVMDAIDATTAILGVIAELEDERPIIPRDRRGVYDHRYMVLEGGTWVYEAIKSAVAECEAVASAAGRVVGKRELLLLFVVFAEYVTGIKERKRRGGFNGGDHPAPSPETPPESPE